jgi:hypothetical protein
VRGKRIQSSFGKINVRIFLTNIRIGNGDLDQGPGPEIVPATLKKTENKLTNSKNYSTLMLPTLQSES